MRRYDIPAALFGLSAACFLAAYLTGGDGLDAFAAVMMAIAAVVMGVTFRRMYASRRR